MNTRFATQKCFLFFFCFMVTFLNGFSQQTGKVQGSSKPAKRRTENIVMIAMDGMRWQEIFTGVDTNIIRNSKFTKDARDLQEKFWDTNVVERRKKLMPFFWTTIVEKGQLYGNR